MGEPRILFAGTSEIAVPTLRSLAGRFNVVGVLTASDKPSGRSRQPVSPPVKLEAQRLGAPVIQCEHVNRQEREAAQALGPDMLVSFSFGRIFGPRFLGIFSRTMNIHPSPLPVARGPAPVQSAILSGAEEWAISFQEIGLQMDCGRLYDVLPFKLDGTETTVTLTQAIAELASEGCVRTLASLGEPREQSGEASYCHLIDKADGVLDFHRPAREVHGRIRAMYDWPKASTTLGDESILITGVWGGFKELDEEPSCSSCAPGTVLEIRKGRGIRVACADKGIWITRVQLPTKKEISFVDLANARRNIRELRFGG